MSTRTLVLGGAIAAAFIAGFGFRSAPEPAAFTYKQFSTIESVVPGGLGRSRMIVSDDEGQEIGKDLLNFYSMTGINFKNIANNDKLIVETINDYVAKGWELHLVSTGVNDSGGGQGGGGGNGIFITRYLFRRPA